ncbi:MAG TPA: phytoene/squalene synthase family protein [Terriglobales bacterium]|nr:phytoene/squalene synthase family protein [Terriglobales bacterium]
MQPAPAQFAPTESQLAVAYSVCRSIARSSAKNFYYAFLALPRHKREALCAVYAYMRRCDDISDDANLPVRERRLKLADWLDTFHRVMQGNPSDDPVLIALADAQRRFKIPIHLLDQLALGTAMDLAEEADDDEPEFARGKFQETAEKTNDAQPTIRYATFDDLYQYCYRVASVVGLVCIRIFGYRDPMAEPLAERCGLAFQMTNIIRDVKEDASMGRVYLPEEDLAKFQLDPAELQGTPDPARWRPLLALEADRAREFYRAGEELIPYISEDSQPALWVLITIYHQLLEKIASQEYDVFTNRISLTSWQKLKVLGKGFVKRLA